MDFKVKISNLPATLPPAEKLEGIGASGITLVTGTSLSFTASGYNSNDQLYQVIAALGLGENSGCKVDITAISVVGLEEPINTGTLFDQPHVAQALERSNREVDGVDKPIQVLANAIGSAVEESQELDPDREYKETIIVKPKSNSDDLVAVYYFVEAVSEALANEGVEFSDLPDDLYDSEPEFIALLADYAVTASQTVTRLYSETSVALPGKFEYEVLCEDSKLVKEFVSYLLDPKPSLPEMEEWEKICLSLISLWIREDRPLPVNDIFNSVKHGRRSVSMANFELRPYKIMITSHEGGEFKIKQI